MLKNDQDKHSTIPLIRKEGHHLIITLNPEISLFNILGTLEQTLRQGHFQEHEVHLIFGQRPLDSITLNEIRQLLEKYQLGIDKLTIHPDAVLNYLSNFLGTIVEFEDQTTPPNELPTPSTPPEKSQTTHLPSQSPEMPLTTQEYAILKEAPDAISPIIPQDPPIAPATQTDEANALPSLEHYAPSHLHKVMKTCRAGTFLEFDGDVIVFGDINAGAEIHATGDIIILGTLKGIANAGCTGNKDAVIIAFSISPTLLRLGGQIARPPEDDEQVRPKINLEIAYLNEDNFIEVKKYTGKVPDLLQERFSTL